MSHGRRYWGSRYRQNAQGNVLVEALVAVLIASIMAAVMVSEYAKVRRLSVGSQTQLQATTIAQQIIDQLRAESWVLVFGNVGNHYPVVNGSAPNPPDPLFPRPLMQDSSLVYASGTSDVKSQALTNLIRCDATSMGGGPNQAYVNIAQGPTAASILVTVQINWKDGSGPHVYTTSTLLSQNGLNN